MWNTEMMLTGNTEMTLIGNIEMMLIGSSVVQQIQHTTKLTVGDDVIDDIRYRLSRQDDRSEINGERKSRPTGEPWSPGG